MKKSRLVAAMTAVALGLLAGAAAAAPAHDHSLEVPGADKWVQIGPPVCDVGAAAEGAFRFHDHVHVAPGPRLEAGLTIGGQLCN